MAPFNLKSISFYFFSYLLYSILSPAYAVVIERVSVDSIGAQGNSSSESASISSDGRFVAFRSSSRNLVPGDTNDVNDIFVHDRDTGVIERVSVDSNGMQGNSDSDSPSISADGRFVAFSSNATNLVPGDTNRRSDLFVHDRDTGVTELVSVDSNGVKGNSHSFSPSISGDGRFIAFDSLASNLVPGDTNDRDDLFVHDRDTGVTERVIVDLNGMPGYDFTLPPSINSDGRFIAFQSHSTTLVPGDTNSVQDIFVHDRDSGVTERVSVDSNGVQGNRHSGSPSISGDGRFVAFGSDATNLVFGNTNERGDVYVHDRNTGVTELVSVALDGLPENGQSSDPSISVDGRFITFLSLVTMLVDVDTRFYNHEVVVHDRNAGVTELVSVVGTSEGRNSTSFSPSISGDGRFIAFDSYSSNLVPSDTNNSSDIFVADIRLFNTGGLNVSVQPSSGATAVGEYTYFRAKLENTSDMMLKNCTAVLINPLIDYQREFSYFSWPLNVANPAINGTIDIAPGEIGQIIMAVLPREAMRREVHFTFACNDALASSVSFHNSVHLVAKTEPLIDEDFVQLINSNNLSELKIDRNNGKYWTPYVLKVINTGTQLTRVNLSTVDTVSINTRRTLCEPVDPANGDWACNSARAEQLQLDLKAGQTKKILVFVHADRAIYRSPVHHRITVAARDNAGEVVAKNSVGVYTLN